MNNEQKRKRIEALKVFAIIPFGLLAFLLGGLAFRGDAKPKAISVPTTVSDVTIPPLITMDLAEKVTPPVLPPDEPSDEPLKPLSELMPLWAVKSNAPNNFQITFKAYNKTEWDTAPTIFETELAALNVIESSKATLKLQYEVGKALSDSLTRMAERMRHK